MNGYYSNANPGILPGYISMSSQGNVSQKIYDEQDAKPAIDDVICHYLDGSTLKNALNFIDFIRASKMKIKWSAANVWSVRYKNKRVLDIVVREGYWRVRLVYDHMKSGSVLKGHEAEYVTTLIGVIRDSMSQNVEPIPAMS